MAYHLLKLYSVWLCIGTLKDAFKEKIEKVRNNTSMKQGEFRQTNKNENSKGDTISGFFKLYQINCLFNLSVMYT